MSGNLKISSFGETINVSCTEAEAKQIESLMRTTASMNFLIGLMIGVIAMGVMFMFLRSLG